MVGFFYFLNSKVEEKKLVKEDVVKTDKIAGAEVISVTNAHISFGLTLDQASPNIGYPTGLKQYPNLTWEEKNIKINSNPRDHDNTGIQYPQFIGGSVVKKLNGYIYSLIDSAISEDKEMIATGGSYDNSVRLSVGYNVNGVYNGIVSIELVMTDFTSGGNGNHDILYPINWDLKSDRLLSPNEIFCSKDWIPTLMPIARKVLVEYVNQHFAKSNDSDSIIDWINDGTSNNPINWQYLLLSDQWDKVGVTVVFQPYQVFSGASGIVKVYIPDSIGSPFLCLP